MNSLIKKIEQKLIPKSGTIALSLGCGAFLFYILWGKFIGDRIETILFNKLVVGALIFAMMVVFGVYFGIKKLEHELGTPEIELMLKVLVVITALIGLFIKIF